MSKLGLYFHIPFCESKCLYCDFASFSGAKDREEAYFKFLLNEIKHSEHKGREVDTIYIGGGTPSCVDANFIKQVLETIKSTFKVDDTAEISMECNPNSVTEEKLKQYKSFGVNRISYGVQSLQEDALKSIGRLHSREQALNAITLAKSVGFKNVSADLMLGLPNAMPEKVIEDAEILISLGITHISSYMLQVEEGTPLFEIVKRNPDFVSSDDESVLIYEKLVKFLEKNGFLRYEISNFALNGYECKHNLKYWAGDEYLGFGLSAHSLIRGKKADQRIANSKTFEDYFSGKKTVENLFVTDKIEEKIMLGLRCKLGFSKSELATLGYNINQNKNLEKFLEQGIILEDDDMIKLNPQYYGVSNFIIVELLP